MVLTLEHQEPAMDIAHHTYHCRVMHNHEIDQLSRWCQVLHLLFSPRLSTKSTDHLEDLPVDLELFTGFPGLPWPTLAELIDHLDSFLNSGANRLCFSCEENQGPIILFPSIQSNSSIRIPRTHGRKKLGSKLIMIPEVVMLLENLMHSSRKSESRHNGKPTGIRQPILPVSLTIISQRDTFCHSDLCKLQF